MLKQKVVPELWLPVRPSWQTSLDSGKRSNAGVTKMTIFSDKPGALMTTLVETGIQSKVGSSDESETTVICIEF